MHDKIKSSFDHIKAEPELLDSTAAYLREVTTRQENNSRRKTSHWQRRMVPALAAICLVVLTGWFSYYELWAVSSYVSIDINPSVELQLSRRDKVLRTVAYGESAEQVLQDLSLKGLSLDDAVVAVVDTVIEQGYLAVGEETLVSCTVYTTTAKKEEELRTGLFSLLCNCTGRRKGIEVFPVDEVTFTQARANSMSPAKYLAYLELVEVDPTATVEGCRSQSVGQIRQRMNEYAAGEGAGYGGGMRGSGDGMNGHGNRMGRRGTQM